MIRTRSTYFKAILFPGVWGGAMEPLFVLSSQNARKVQEMFPAHPRFSRLLFRALDDGGGGHNNTGAPNVLTKAIFDEIWGVVHEVGYMIDQLCPQPYPLASTSSSIDQRWSLPDKEWEWKDTTLGLKPLLTLVQTHYYSYPSGLPNDAPTHTTSCWWSGVPPGVPYCRTSSDNTHNRNVAALWKEKNEEEEVRLVPCGNNQLSEIHMVWAPMIPLSGSHGPTVRRYPIWSVEHVCFRRSLFVHALQYKSSWMCCYIPF